MDPIAVLQRLGNGRFIDDLHEAVAATAQEVVETGKAGTVTVTLKISAANGQGDPFVTVADEIQRKPPKKDPKATFFFALDNELHRDDPRQTVMEFRTVNKETGEIIDVRETPVIREAK